MNPRYRGMSAGEVSEYCLKHYGKYQRPPDYYMDVGCGKCHSCQVKRLAGFRMRLQYELERYPNSLFITLSFTDESLEEYKDNYNLAVCQFLDALRKEYGKSIRHFFVCEFGTLNGRPHYHGILFNVPWLDFYKVESIWNRGNGLIRKKHKDNFIGFFRKPRGIIYLEGIREMDKITWYLCKYLTKEFQSEKQPRVLISRNLGVGYLSPSQIRLHKRLLLPNVSYGGKLYPLPRFYSSRIFTQEEKDQMVVNRWNSDPTPRYIGDQVFYPVYKNFVWSYPGYDDALKSFARRQQFLGLSPAFVHSYKQPKKSTKLNLFNIVNYEFEQ